MYAEPRQRDAGYVGRGSGETGPGGARDGGPGPGGTRNGAPGSGRSSYGGSSYGPYGEPAVGRGYDEARNGASSRRAAAGLRPAPAQPGYPSPLAGALRLPDRRRPAVPDQPGVPRQPGPVSAPLASPAGPGPDLGDESRCYARPDSGRLNADQAVPATGTRTHRRHGRTPAREARPRPRLAQASRTLSWTWPRVPAGTWRGIRFGRRTLLLLGAGLLAVTGVIVAVMLLGSGPAGPEHTLVTPQRLGAYQRKPDLARQMGVSQLQNNILAQSSGQVSNLVSAVYQNGSTVSGGPTPQVMLFIGGQLTGASADAAIQTFTQHFRNAVRTSPGKLGGTAACVPGQASTGGAAVCAWFDDDTFGELVSPNMTASALANELRTIRPSVELRAR